MSFCGNRREEGDSFRINEDIEGGQNGQCVRNGGDSMRRSSSSMKILGPDQSWRIIFGVSCVIAIAMDPLFFYVPVIDEDKKCIGLDKKLRTTALILRSVTDIIGVINIILQFHRGYIDEQEVKINDPWKIARYLWPYFLIDILVILPFPQVIILIIFRELRGSKSLNTRKVLTCFVFFQYVLRIIQIYQSWKDPTRRANKLSETAIWLKAAFNFSLYIIASHVLGGFWYFLSIERETACWHMGCENHIGCIQSSFNCDHNLGNYTFLNDFCPINTPNTTLFDFGIFLGALQSGVVHSENFFEKFSQCFWWGLRNLSSLGQNLQASNNVWETCFTILISIFGLLLFSYFIGNLQLYMQLDETAKAEERRSQMREEKMKREEEKMKREEEEMKMKGEKRAINMWMSKYMLPREMKEEIIKHVQQNLERNHDVNVQNLWSYIPRNTSRAVKFHLCMDLLKRVPILQNWDEQRLQDICHSLEPVYYDAQSYIVREGEPIDAMIFIKDGIAWNYKSSNGDASGSSLAECLESGHFFGEELLDFLLELKTLSLPKLPISTRTVKTYKTLEGFALMAKDLRIILNRNRAYMLLEKFKQFHDLETKKKKWSNLKCPPRAAKNCRVQVHKVIRLLVQDFHVSCMLGKEFLTGSFSDCT